MPFLASDLRWKRLTEGAWRCANCDSLHQGVFDIGFDRPNIWQDPGEPSPNTALENSRHVLTEDFCIYEGQHYFARCVLLLPIAGTDEQFGFGIWSSLSETSFGRYLDTFMEGATGEEGGPWFGYLSNSLRAYPETLSLKLQVRPQADGSRPLLELEPTDHPLAVEQRNGLSLDRLLEIYAAYGHSFAA